MFEKTITALGQFEGQRQQVAFSGDEDGYFDRECPSEGCLFQFKVHGDDWKNIVRDVEVFCPNCAHCADASKWWTQEQLAHARDVAMHQISSTLSSALRQDAQSWNAHRRLNGFLSITMSVNSKPQQVPVPFVALEPMKLRINRPALSRIKSRTRRLADTRG